jgi:putative peptidoglycan lipid II flippase
MIPMIFGSSVTQINMIIDTVIASFLITGSIGWLYMSDRFVELPLALFGISIATVLLPKLSEFYSNSNSESYNSTINWGLKLGILISLPTTIGLILLSKPILITLLQYKEFTLNDMHMTSISLIAFAFGLPGMIGAKILITNYYSRKDTRYPVKAALIAVACNFILNISFVTYLIKTNFNGAHVGLALATSISAYINFYFLFTNARKTKILVMDRTIGNIFVKSLVATFIMSLFILYFNLGIESWVNLELFERLTKLFLIIIFSIIIYFILLIAFKISPKNINNEK